MHHNGMRRHPPGPAGKNRKAQQQNRKKPQDMQDWIDAHDFMVIGQAQPVKRRFSERVNVRAAKAVRATEKRHTKLRGQPKAHTGCP